MSKYLSFYMFSFFLLITNCASVPQISYIENRSEEDKALGKNRIMIQFSENDSLICNMKINTNKNILLKNGISLVKPLKARSFDNTKNFEYQLDDSSNYIKIHYGKKEYKINLDKRYALLFLDLNLGRLEVGFSNSEPQFMVNCY
ncbi:hypothetical protein ASG01_05915 [Chryseobacterium sp. Leaf180]|uniref:hypothetical protein n=1 Tax=Chryseobacterium sp. Leaf180 TaxID=1736289 RepID=UPI0007124A7E|nr:hypothetical protein [Chryseobacterium sp. Leaf180]KQR95382.1 hypothetical protein ASG01_05915 [Chryseobacterium sp. Leaf180]